MLLIHLQGKEGKHHQTENGQSHDLRQLPEGVEQSVDDGLEARHNGNGLQSSQYTKGSQAGQIAHIHADGGVARGYHHKVQPVPGIPEVGVLVQQKALGRDLDNHLDGVNGQENVPANGGESWLSGVVCCVVASGLTPPLQRSPSWPGICN